VSALVRLYPRAWRDRYEAEFLAVLVDRPPRWGDHLDIVFAALDAHLHPEVPAPEPGADRLADPDRDGRPVAAALAGIGGVLWLATVPAMLLTPTDGDGQHGSMPALIFAQLGQIAVGCSALVLGRDVSGRHRGATVAGLVLLLGAAAMLLGWPWVVLGIYAGFVGSMLVGASLVANGGRVVGPLLVVAALVAFGLNTQTWYALLALPYGVAWMTVAGWLLTDRARRPVDAPRPE
jgi:hypothetical protein